MCEEYFHDSCFARDLQSELSNVQKKKLCEGAIPTIFSTIVFREINIDGTIVIYHLENVHVNTLLSQMFFLELFPTAKGEGKAVEV